MKRRVIKKNINRFITPLIKDLPRTNSFSYVQETEKDGMSWVQVMQNQYIIVNGRKRKEGELSFPCNNLLLNIRRTADEIKKIIDEHEQVIVRVPLEVVYGNQTYIRLITE